MLGNAVQAIKKPFQSSQGPYDQHNTIFPWHNTLRRGAESLMTPSGGPPAAPFMHENSVSKSTDIAQFKAETQGDAVYPRVPESSDNPRRQWLNLDHPGLRYGDAGHLIHHSTWTLPGKPDLPTRLLYGDDEVGKQTPTTAEINATLGPQFQQQYLGPNYSTNSTVRQDSLYGLDKRRLELRKEGEDVQAAGAAKPTSGLDPADIALPLLAMLAGGAYGASKRPGGSSLRGVLLGGGAGLGGGLAFTGGRHFLNLDAAEHLKNSPGVAAGLLLGGTGLGMTAGLRGSNWLSKQVGLTGDKQNNTDNDLEELDVVRQAKHLPSGLSGLGRA